MSNEILKDIINDFSVDKFIRFFRLKTKKFSLNREELLKYNNDLFTEGSKLGEINFEYDKLIICAFRVKKELSERSGKKAQYEVGKKILKDTQSDAGIFIFYDKNRNFRFSLIFTEYFGINREFSYFKRFTFYVSDCLTNKTFIQQIGSCNFSSLEEIKQAFSIEPVTKHFYEEIQNWYFWAMDEVKFPEDFKCSDRPEKDKKIRNATNLIRLLTRIIFIWFIKEKKLIPEILFDKSELKEIVKDFGNGNNYYNAILQNLFFATLNSKMDERKFAEDDGFLTNRKEYGVKILYRYADKFLIPKQDVLNLFKDIPFLNGGLFDCLDKEDENGTVIYIDGFSRNPKKQAVVPDYLFFKEKEEKVDLSQYGIGSDKLVRGLIEILKSYNFTIDENTPIDQEVALDPELLGKVFENLLASYNPETATTARKATGSYYTPREIVDYMVEESLFEYLKTKFPEISEDEIRLLLSYSDGIPELTEEEKQKIITVIGNIKILDPACGSGAFPMGILHKLVHILTKLDPDNKYWHEIQYQKALKASEEVFKERNNKAEREELLKEINDAFDENINYPDYARKLYLIENCIYGIDIQPIAVQISKLRFFISLVLDQKVDRGKENLGVRPLPNLETKFVAADTLIALESPESPRLKDPDIKEKEEQLEELRHKYFTAKTRTQKKRIQKKYKKLREKIAKLLIKDRWGEQTVKKIASFDPFDQNTFADWFDPKWMFGVVDGFDIAIGNPPYVRQEKIKPLKHSLKEAYKDFFNSTSDLYIYFYKKSYDILRNHGILCFISSNKWMRAKYGEKLRKFLKENTKVKELIDFSGYSVFEQTVDTNIIIFQKENPGKVHALYFVNVKSDVDDVISYIQNNKRILSQQKLSDNAWTLADERVLALKEKIEKIGKPLKDWDVKIYFGIKTGFNEAFIIDTKTRDGILANCKTQEERKRTEEIIKPILRGRDIGRYYYKWAGLWVIKIESGWTNKNRRNEKPEEFFKKMSPSIYRHLISFANKEVEGSRKGLLNRDDQGDYWWELRNCAYYPEFEKEKIVWQEIVREPSFAYDNTGIYCEATSFLMTGKNLKYIIGLLNSKPVMFFFRNYYAGGGLGEEGYRYKKAFLKQLPLPPITPQNQPLVTQIESLVSQILNVDTDKNVCATTNQQKQAKVKELEKQIDQLIYKLYDLTEEEIKIIEKGDK
ncbi:MAG TPA: TaqI-like C-terminal specificity domain-containing protein [bacterium]|nr:TaqI-like C-terminal specificity domain-containing protein [bacterium]